MNGLGGSGHTLASPSAKSIMQPRVYTYKITFEEAPYWYWGVHKERKFGEPYLGSPKTHEWMWGFYTPKLQILEIFPLTNRGWDEAQKVEKRLIRPDLNDPFCLNENCGGILSIEARARGGRKSQKEGKGVFARTLEEMREDGRRGANIANERKDELGRSVSAVRGANATNAAKGQDGKSINAVKGGQRGAATSHKEKDEEGKSVNARRAAEILHSAKDETGRSVASLTIVAQRWRSTVDGFESNAGNVARHNKANGWPAEKRVKIP